MAMHEVGERECRVEWYGTPEVLERYKGWVLSDVKVSVVEGFRVIKLRNPRSGECVSVWLDWPTEW